MTEQPLDPASIAFLERTQAMRRLSRDEVIQTLWQRIRFAPDEYIPFVLLGALDWHAPMETRLEDESGLVWIRPSRDTDDIAPTSSTSVHDLAIWVGIRAPASRTDATETLPVLEKALERAHVLTDLFSLMYGMPLVWYPAVYLGVQAMTAGEAMSRPLLATSRTTAAMTRVIVPTEEISAAVLPRFDALRPFPTSHSGSSYTQPLAGMLRGTAFTRA